jgi:hypothetical protein
VLHAHEVLGGEIYVSVLSSARIVFIFLIVYFFDFNVTVLGIYILKWTQGSF